MKKAILWLFLMLLPGLYLVFNQATAQSKIKTKNTIVKYKKYESFDLGNLEIKGDILAPGDLSVGERERKVFNRDLFIRLNYKKEGREDILNLR